MKKNILVLIAVCLCLNSQGQNINPDNDYAPARKAALKKKRATCCADSSSGWCIDGNLTAGFLMQNITSSPLAGYSNQVNSGASEIKFQNGYSRGFDVGISCYFGKQKNYGIGMGLMYLYQQGDLTMDHFHVEYKSVDNFGNTFRQVLTSNGQIKESVKTSNLSIPVLFKYNRWITKKVGFNMDLGPVINVLEENEVNTDASFNYEAIYKYTGPQGNVKAVYDNSPTPGANDLIITKARYESTQTGQSVDNYFKSLSNQGYNVGLGVRPTYTSGKVDYNKPSVGFLIRPAIGLMLHSGMSLNFGAYYLIQNFTNNVSNTYMVTDKRGTYNPLANSISNSVNHCAGISVGFKYCFPRYQEPAPPPPPVVEEVASPAPPEEEEEVYEAPVSYTAPILFELDKSTIRPEAYPILEAAVREIHENEKGTLIINGYTDNTGTVSYNKALSKRRAVAVRNYLHRQGIRNRAMKAIGHGPKHPAASNGTAEGRAKNRRVEMKMKQR
jgi:outer membrane protein OmpA-like peptidoglycan-associated protein